ncbi:ROK family protein [Occultella kanbiaonis]|uniref:ROK family protein n=1 Tax=Occultella kanbiaonis TaxID=2675754 RepID=UPI0013D6FF5A
MWIVSAGTYGVEQGENVAQGTEGSDRQDFETEGRLAGIFDRRVLVEHAGNLAAVAERWRGAAQDASDFLCVTLGSSFGTGIVIRDQLYRGHHGFAGGIPSLPRLVRESAATLLGPNGHADVGETVFAAARSDPFVEPVAVDRLARVVAARIASIVRILDPERVVLRGDVTTKSDVLLEPVRRHLHEHALRPPIVTSTTLGADAVAIGAVRVALDFVEAQIDSHAHAHGCLPPPRRHILVSPTRRSHTKGPRRGQSPRG